MARKWFDECRKENSCNIPYVWPAIGCCCDIHILIVEYNAPKLGVIYFNMNVRGDYLVRQAHKQDEFR